MESDNTNAEASSIVEITRRTTYWMDLLRAYDVYIDGRFVGEIRDGEDKTFCVTPGIHAVVLRIDWCRSPYLSLLCEPGATARLACRGQVNPLVGIFLGIVMWNRYIHLAPTEPD